MLFLKPIVDMFCEWQVYSMHETICLLFRGKCSTIKCLYCKYRREME